MICRITGLSCQHKNASGSPTGPADAFKTDNGARHTASIRSDRIRLEC